MLLILVWLLQPAFFSVVFLTEKKKKKNRGQQKC